MPKLCDIVKPGVPCKVRFGIRPFQWTGRDVHCNEKIILNAYDYLFDDDWQLDEPTVESVLRERGYSLVEYQIRLKVCCVSSARVFLELPLEKRPTTVAQVTAICDLLDSYR